MEESEKREIKKAFAERLMSILKERKLSQQKLSNDTGKAAAQISRLLSESSNEFPTMDFLIKLNELYGLNINWLLAGSGEKYSQDISPTFSKKNSLVDTISYIDSSVWDFDKPILPDTVVYFKENKREGITQNKLFQKFEEIEGRIYISPIFPSGLHRLSKDDPSQEARNNTLKDPDKKNIEIYTIDSVLNFAFNTVSRKVLPKSVKVSMLENLISFFSKSLGSKELILFDNSENGADFYGFATIRLVNKDYILTTDAYRTVRIERSFRRYKSIEEEYRSPENMKYCISSIGSITIMEKLKEALSKGKSLKEFLKLLDHQPYLKMFENNCSLDLPSS